MYPTLTGDCELALVDTHYKGGVGIRVGDVVRFWHPHGLDQALAKRVKGLEGHKYTKNLQGLGIERVVVSINSHSHLHVKKKSLAYTYVIF
jgi:hypothetical protein